MYYRIFDSTSGDYLPASYNTTDKDVVRKELECLLIDLSEDEPISSLTFNKLKDKAANAGLSVETSAEPFEPARTSSIVEGVDWGVVGYDWDELDGMADEWDGYDHIDGEF